MRTAQERTAILLVLALLSTACGGTVETAEPRGDPFVWERSEVAAHLGLREIGDLVPVRLDTPDGTTCEVTIRTSAIEIHLARADGRRIVTSTHETVGVEIVGPPLDPPQPGLGSDRVEVDPACYAALPADLDDLEPGPRDEAERRADLDALDAELREGARDNVPGTVDEGWWPGLDISASEDAVTLTGYSLGRCRTVTVARDGAVTDPADC